MVRKLSLKAALTENIQILKLAEPSDIPYCGASILFWLSKAKFRSILRNLVKQWMDFFDTDIIYKKTIELWQIFFFSQLGIYSIFLNPWKIFHQKVSNLVCIWVKSPVKLFTDLNFPKKMNAVWSCWATKHIQHTQLCSKPCKLSEVPNKTEPVRANWAYFHSLRRFPPVEILPQASRTFARN